MSHLLQLELGGIFLVCWVGSLVAMWFLVNRTTRPGPIRSVIVIEGMMLASIFCLILGITLTIWGSGAAD
jgi:hypothetical protein